MGALGRGGRGRTGRSDAVRTEQRGARGISGAGRWEGARRPWEVTSEARTPRQRRWRARRAPARNRFNVPLFDCVFSQIFSTEVH
jgi:hypothetical protein